MNSKSTLKRRNNYILSSFPIAHLDILFQIQIRLVGILYNNLDSVKAVNIIL